MGGPDGSFNGRWRVLDGLRQWYDPHDLVVLVGAALGGALIMLAFVVVVFASSVWMRTEYLEKRLDRMESAVFKRANLDADDDKAEAIGGW